MIATEVMSGGPESEPWSAKRKKALRVGLIAIAAAAGGALYQLDRLEKFPTVEEEIAQSNIYEIFDAMTTNDFIDCSLSGPPFAKVVKRPLIGPHVGKRPSIATVSVNVSVETSRQAVSNRVSTAGRYSATILSNSPRLESWIRYVPFRSNAVRAHHHDSDEYPAVRNTVYKHVLPFQQTESLHVEMPIHPRADTAILIDVVPVVGSLWITETTKGDLEMSSSAVHKELVGNPCVTLLASVDKDHINDVVVLE